MEQLKLARLAKGLTQQQMAETLGYASKSTYSQIETGKKIPAVDVALRMSKILEKPVEVLFSAFVVLDSRTERETA